MASLFSRAALRTSSSAIRSSSRSSLSSRASFASSVAAPRFAALARPSSRTFATSALRPKEQPRLRLGSEAPNFKAVTTHGEIDFHEFLGGKWTVLFSHPADFTPVCTTELGAFARLAPEFAARGVQLIGLSADSAESHGKWVRDINEVAGPGTDLRFPIIADESREVAWLYDMVDQQDVTNKDRGGIAFTIRAVFVIDPAKKIRLSMLYPASVGRNSAEVLRVVDALQTGDKKGVTTPIDWTVGQDVIVPPSVSTEDAKKKFADVREVKPYLRFTSGKLKE